MPNRYEDALNRIAEKFRKTAETAAKEGMIPYQKAPMTETAGGPGDSGPD